MNLDASRIQDIEDLSSYVKTVKGKTKARMEENLHKLQRQSEDKKLHELRGLLTQAARAGDTRAVKYLSNEIHRLGY